METVPLFDWLRWVDIPVLFGLAGWFWCHQKHDHEVEVQIKEKLGKLDELEGMKNMLALVLDKLIPDRKEL